MTAYPKTLKRTEEVRRAEEVVGTPLAKKLVEALNAGEEQQVLANRIGVTRVTLARWLLLLGVEQRWGVRE